MSTKAKGKDRKKFETQKMSFLVQEIQKRLNFSYRWLKATC